MKKNFKLTIVIVLIISATVSLLFVGCKSDDILPIISWMEYINDDALLKNIVIPGSHDTGTYDLKFVSKTQHKNMSEQLACGTRYFDLRFDLVDNQLVMYHGFHGSLYQYKVMYDDNALTVLSQIKEFLQTYTTETLILDITNVFDEAKPLLFSAVCYYLGDFAVVNDTKESDLNFVENLKLGECRGKCLILWGADNDIYLKENFIFKRNNDGGNRNNCVLHSFYNANYNGKYTSNKYISSAIPQYIEDYRKVGSGLFVLQGQLTDSMGVFGPRVKEDSHYVNMNEYVLSLAKSEDLKDINIIMRDFVGFSKNACALKLNLSKGYVKEGYKEKFEKMATYNIKMNDEVISN